MKDARYGIRVTWVGLWINLFLGVFKSMVGWFVGSSALIADGLHSLIDLISDVAVLFGLTVSQIPEDEGHHYGHYKYASLAKLFIGGILVCFALSLVVSAVLDIKVHTQAETLAGWGAVCAIASLIIKEALFWWTRKVAKSLNSNLLLANAWHHRTDSLSSLGVAAALVGVWFGGEDWAFLDGVVTLVLGCYLAFESGRIFFQACGDLLDAAPKRAIIEDLREHILPTPGAVAYHDFRVRRVGDFYEVDLHLQVDSKISVASGHAIASQVKERLQKQHPEVCQVLVHIEPASTDHIRQRGIFDGSSTE